MVRASTISLFVAVGIVADPGGYCVYWLTCFRQCRIFCLNRGVKVSPAVSPEIWRHQKEAADVALTNAEIKRATPKEKRYTELFSPPDDLGPNMVDPIVKTIFQSRLV